MGLQVQRPLSTEEAVQIIGGRNTRGDILADIIDEVGLPKGVFNLVTGLGPVVGEAIVVHPKTDMVSFTGSTRAGKRVMQLASEMVKRVSLELGGSRPT